MSYTLSCTLLCVTLLFLMISPVFALTNEEISVLNNLSQQHNISNATLISIFQKLEANDSSIYNSTFPKLDNNVSLLHAQWNDLPNYYYQKNYIDTGFTQVKNDIQNLSGKATTIIYNNYTTQPTENYTSQMRQLENETEERMQSLKNFTDARITLVKNETEWLFRFEMAKMAKQFDDALLKNTFMAAGLGTVITIIVLFMLRKKNIFIQEDKTLKALIRKLEMVLPPVESEKHLTRDLTLGKSLRERQTKIRKLKIELLKKNISSHLYYKISEMIDNDTIKTEEEINEQIRVDVDDERRKNSRDNPSKKKKGD